MIQKNSVDIPLKIGTSGYSYEDWRNHFYPPDIPKGAMLEFYRRYFQTVEINASYYFIPKPQVFKRMGDKTPADFEFIVKTNQETTHRRNENEKALESLIEAVKPLIEQQKFKGFLAQFPYSFKNNEKNRRYLAECKQLIGDLPLFVEFRNYTWLTPQLNDFLSGHHIGYVNVDEPPLKGLIPPQHIVTSDRGYVRFHGRNGNDWWQGKGAARYDYEYKKEELQEWLTHLSQIMRKTYKAYIFFNNHPNGQAVRNARQMIQIIENQLQLILES